MNQGEDVQTTVNSGIVHWQLAWPQLNKTYTFKAVLNVPNDTGAPFDFQPIVQLDGQRHTSVCNGCTGQSITVIDPTLDGGTPGAGTVTFSADGTDHTWAATHADLYGVVYEGTQLQGDQQPSEVPLVVKPGSEQPAPVNPKSTGVIPVAILSTSVFDATTVDPVTVTFGPMGPIQTASKHTAIEDVNGDGQPDMVLTFPVLDGEFGCGATSVSISGQTTDGQQISGSAPIRTVGCKV